MTLKMNMQLESQYSLRMYGGLAMDCRYLGFLDGPTVLSRQFPGSNGIDAIPNSASSTLNGISPAIFSGGIQGATTGTVVLSATISYINHLATPLTVTATDLGTNYRITVAWTNAASYGSSDMMYCYNNSGNALLGIALASAGTMTINGLTNGVAYTVYLKASYNATSFGSASNTATATPTGNSLGYPAVANVWNGDTVNGVPGTLVEIGASNVRFGTTGGRGGIAVTGTVHVPIAANVSIGVATDVSATGTLDVGAAVLGATVEGTLSVQDALKISAAALAGKTSIVPLGGGNATVTFRNIEDTKDRITANMTGSERTSVALDKT